MIQVPIKVNFAYIKIFCTSDIKFMANYVRFNFCAVNMRRKTRNKQINKNLEGHSSEKS